MATLITIISSVTYAAGYLFAFRRIAGQMAWHFFAADKRKYPSLNHDKMRPEGEQWLGAILSATFFALVWPLSLPIAYGISDTQMGISKFLYVPQNEKDRIREAYIRELERKAGIR